MEDQTLELFIKELQEVKEEKAILAEDKKKLDEKQAYLEEMIISRLRGEGLTKASTQYGTAFIRTESHPSIEDWKAALDYINKNEMWAVLKKSVNSAFWRELKDSGVEIPGIGVFTKDSLLFRRK